MKTKQLTYPSIEIQQQYWIDKDAASDNATNETREEIAQRMAKKIAADCYGQAITDTSDNIGRAAKLILLAIERGIQSFLCEHNGQTLHVSRTGVASNPNMDAIITADPKPETDDLSRTEATCDFYDHQLAPDESRDAYINDNGGGSVDE